MSVEMIDQCRKCGSKSWSYSDYRERSQENHCLSEDCGFFMVSSPAWSGNDYRNAEEVREFIEDHALEEEEVIIKMS